MPSNVEEPLHSIAMVLVALVALVTMFRALRRSEILVGGALLSGATAELMKSPWVIETFVDPSIGRLVWRVLVQAICLLAMVLLLEALRSSLWGVMWDSKPMLGWLAFLLFDTSMMVGLVIFVPGEPARIEDIGGAIPAFYLLLFAVPVLVIAGTSLVLVWQNRRVATWSLWLGAAVVVGYGIDAGTLAGTYIVSDQEFGRANGGVLWAALIAGGVLILLGTIQRPAITPPEAREIRIFALWLHLSKQEGFTDPDQTLRSWKSGGRPLAWIYVVRSCIDMLAAQSARTGTAQVVSSIAELDELAASLDLPAGRLSDLSRNLG